MNNLSNHSSYIISSTNVSHSKKNKEMCSDHTKLNIALKHYTKLIRKKISKHRILEIKEDKVLNIKTNAEIIGSCKN